MLFENEINCAKIRYSKYLSYIFYLLVKICRIFLNVDLINIFCMYISSYCTKKYFSFLIVVLSFFKLRKYKELN